MSKLRELILLLGQGNPLPPHHKDHPLAGKWKTTATWNLIGC
jgi:mRNA-degrading endonuclease YafQ of YafQ-DinJ toxin-antitoxin module